jgi:hypothetical protein
LLEGAQEKHKTPDSTFDFDTVEDMNEEERWKEEEIWETLSVAENREELGREVKTIDGLIDRAGNIIQNEEEIKLKELKKISRRPSAETPREKRQENPHLYRVKRHPRISREED